MIKKSIQLATISTSHFSPWLPYAAGCLISYCNRDPVIASQYEFSEPIFEYRKLSEYTEQLSEADYLGLTCYVWNQIYNDKLAAMYKRHRPDGIVIYGGPNIPEEEDVANAFIAARPYLDVMFVGPGERNFAAWLKGEGDEGTVTREKYNVSNMRAYQIKGDDLPTPYTDLLFDDIFKRSGMLKVPFETNRGCPYSCAFCDWGGQSRSKLSVFDEDIVLRQLDYIYKQRNVSELELLDANFGVLPRDVSLVEYMIELQELHDNKIKLGYAGLAKNGSKHLPRILDLFSKSMNLDQRNQKLSFQSHTPLVLDNIDRSNIDNSKLLLLLDECKRTSVVTTSELIIGMPGETADTWLDSIATNHNYGINYIRTYIFNYVPNTSLYSAEYRKKFAIKSKKLRFPYTFGGLSYKFLHNNPGHTSTDFSDYEEFEITTEMYSWDIDELVKMSDYHWWYHNMWNGGVLRPVVTDVKSEVLMFYKYIDQMPFMKSLVEKNRSIVRRLYSADEPEEITDLETYLYYTKCMR